MEYSLNAHVEKGASVSSFYKKAAPRLSDPSQETSLSEATKTNGPLTKMFPIFAKRTPIKTSTLSSTGETSASPASTLSSLSLSESSENQNSRRCRISSPDASKSVPTTPTSGVKRPLKTYAKTEGKAVKKSRKKMPFIDSNEQYAIDAGQKDFDASRCKTCHMIYTKGEVTDEKHHADYHETFTKGIRWSQWLKPPERVLRYSSTENRIERVVAVLPSDPKSWLKKVDSLFSIADRELGINMSLFDCIKSSSVYLILVSTHVNTLQTTPSSCGQKRASPSINGRNSPLTPVRKTKDERVAGFLAAEGIQEANRLVSENPLAICTEFEPAVVGVTRLWVRHEFRKSGVATKLLDTLRANYLKLTKSSGDSERILKKEEIAFSDPTDDGLIFAQKYTTQKKFLVFQYQLEAPPKLNDK